MSVPIPKPTPENPRPGVSTMEMRIFYLNCVIKALHYFPSVILSVWLNSVGWNSSEVGFAWSAYVAAKIASGPILGWCSDHYKVRIPLLSLSAMVVGICDISLPYVLHSQSVSFFSVVFFFRSFFVKAMLCKVWIADWLPPELTTKSVQKLNLILVLTHALACILGLLLYDPLGADNILKGYGVLSLASAPFWWWHRDNVLGMERSVRKSHDGLTVMDGPLKDLLPDKGFFLLGWPLFVVCIICLSFEAITLAGMYSVGFLYATDMGVAYSSITFVLIGYLLIMMLAQVLLRVMSSRAIATVLVAFVMASGLPWALGVEDSSLLIILYGFILSTNYFIWTVIASLLVLTFNEAWKARMMGLFQLLRHCFEVVGIYAITAVYEVNEELLMPSFMVCSLMVYVFFLVASCSLPSNHKKSENISKFRYKTLNEKGVVSV